MAIKNPQLSFNHHLFLYHPFYPPLLLHPRVPPFVHGIVRGPAHPNVVLRPQWLHHRHNWRKETRCRKERIFENQRTKTENVYISNRIRCHINWLKVPYQFKLRRQESKQVFPDFADEHSLKTGHLKTRRQGGIDFYRMAFQDLFVYVQSL